MPYVSPRTAEVQPIQHQDIVPRSWTVPFATDHSSTVFTKFYFVRIATRRSRSTTSVTPGVTSTTAKDGELSYVESNEEHPWDSTKVQKLDARSNAWSINNDNSSNENIEILNHENSGIPEGKSYGEIPNPISIPKPNPVSPTYVPSPLPPLPPGCLTSRGQFSSPKSCANYLNCWDDTVVEQTCPNGLLFNDFSNVCDFDYNVNCGSRPLPTPKPPLPPGSKFCPDPYGRYRSSMNCSEFYVCLASKPIKFGCPQGLVYNDELGVCDYVRNVDCKGSATPKPQPQPQPSTTQSWSTASAVSVQYPSYPSHPSQSPYPTQQPPYIPQQPTRPSPYLATSWGSNVNAEPWQQLTKQQDVQKEDQEIVPSKPETLQESPESSSITNPWTVLHTIPASMSKVPCTDGDLHKLDDACTSVIICRAGRPQLVRCTTGMIYDRPTDSCKPFVIAKW
ncbi:PREDICTED: probable chitinase 3 [Polistes canadensis]|uniref:probable chitinase 3 n=1 Tax=Polistes canadensis TaxID=91411 RepID=UPI000718B59B|nr:PREDICTED: probable chitinase 3 [Polistes canadensis]